MSKPLPPEPHIGKLTLWRWWVTGQIAWWTRDRRQLKAAGFRKQKDGSWST